MKLPRSTARFLLLALVFTMSLPTARAADDSVTAERKGAQIIFRAGDREVARFQAEPGKFPREGIAAAYRRGGYLHPILTPSGRLVSDDFPPNHVHHHGVWMAWTKTQFEGRAPDFWNVKDGTGRVEFMALDGVWQKDGRAGLTARLRHVDLTPKPPQTALNETWEVTVSAADQGGKRPRHIIDLSSTQTCATDSPLVLPEYHYGGFGFRGNRGWDGPDACRFLTSEGITDRVKGNDSRGKWCWVGGTLDGQTAGVAILCHPENFRAPQPMRLHPHEPFFCYAPPQLGEMRIEPGKPLISRYRIIAVDGEPDRAEIDAWWEAYAGESPRR